MNLYRDLKKRSLLLCLPLSLLLLAIPALYAPITFEALADGGLVLAFPAIVTSWPWGIWGYTALSTRCAAAISAGCAAMWPGHPIPQRRSRPWKRPMPPPNPLSGCACAAPGCFTKKGPATHLYEIGEVLWVYQLNKSVTQFFITTTRRFLVVGLANRTRIKCRMSELQIQQCMNAFCRRAHGGAGLPGQPFLAF